MIEEFEREQVEFRKGMPEAPSELLIEVLLTMQWMLALRSTTKGLKLHDELLAKDQQYSLNLFTAKQELLKRLAK